MDWKSQAACKGQTELFFSGETRKQLEAKRICQQCEVHDQCLKESETIAGQYPLYGIWASQGKNTRERYLGRQATLWSAR